MNDFAINRRAQKLLEDNYPFAHIEVSYNAEYMTYKVDVFDMVGRIPFHEGKPHIYSKKYHEYELGKGDEMIELLNFLESYYNKKDYKKETENECNIHALSCPSCGAKIKRGSKKCDYCLTEFYYS